MNGVCIKIHFTLQPRPIKVLCKSVRSIKVQSNLIVVNAMQIFQLTVCACFNFCGAVVYNTNNSVV